MIRIIGDVHGKFDRYKTLLKNTTHPSIQVGDMGIGFKRYDRVEEAFVTTANPPYDAMLAANARFIRGNHDNPAVCRKHSQYIEDGTIAVIDAATFMFIGGARSIDQQRRTENIDWWADEECSQGALQQFLDIYEHEKPDIMITHDCPGMIAQRLVGSHKSYHPTRTAQAFDAMFELHQPDHWFFGHWHTQYNECVNHTDFHCLDELEYFDL